MTDFDNLKTSVTTFPKLPGVYLMKETLGEIIYIGKAKDLRNRVRSYFMRSPLSEIQGDGRFQIPMLLAKVKTIDFIVTKDERDAFILERDLIVKHKPKYNVRLKDDKSYLNIRIDTNDPWPRLELTRKVHDDGAMYFGPYVQSYELKSLLEVIKRVIPLRSCTNTIFYNRQRPCLEYEIKRCSGPCCLPVDKNQYSEWVLEAISLLQGKVNRLLEELNIRMEAASDNLRYEEAAAIRDRIQLIAKFAKEGGKAPIRSGSRQDCFGLFRDASVGVITVLRTSNDRIQDSISFELENLEISDDEVLEAGISQFYEGGRTIPNQIILPFEIENQSLIEEVLNSRISQEGSYEDDGIKGVEIVVPKRGSKFQLVNLAYLNASQTFENKFDSERLYMESVKELAVKCKLSQIPRRIECLDISNFQGTDIVGAIVSFFDGKPDRERYRKFKVKNINEQNDFYSIYEIVKRRFDSIEEREGEHGLPDLLIIDGGLGQLNSALKAKDELNLSLDIISLAKARTESNLKDKNINRTKERVYVPGEEEPIEFISGTQVCNLLERIRDAAHKHVITFHRNTRNKRTFTSILDSIPGIGPKRRREILKVFPGPQALNKASLEDLMIKAKLSRQLAERILASLR